MPPWALSLMKFPAMRVSRACRTHADETDAAPAAEQHVVLDRRAREFLAAPAARRARRRWRPLTATLPIPTGPSREFSRIVVPTRMPPSPTTALLDPLPIRRPAQRCNVTLLLWVKKIAGSGSLSTAAVTSINFSIVTPVEIADNGRAASARRQIGLRALTAQGQRAAPAMFIGTGASPKL